MSDDRTETADEPGERGARGALPAASPGTRCGRYILLDEIGAGGVGVVFRAYDPDLDRQLAIKLMRLTAGLGAAAADRLLREAKAIAQLSHPNVTSVYDVGWHNRQVFIAMELAQGGSLKTWLDAGRARDDILRMFIGAGEGLAAAHSERLVHRDFKPANVLVDARGTPKVADFGLARLFGDGPSQSVLAAGSPGSARASTATETGAVVGTPAYMAPEQLAGEQVDARADQYSFSVALCEALTGTRAGASELALALSKVEGLSPRVRAALARSLSPAPSDRYESMGELLDHLRAPKRWSRRSGLLAIGVAPVVIVAGLLFAALRQDETSPCANLSETTGSTWSLARSDAVAHALSTEPDALAIWRRTAPVLERYAADLNAARVDSCRATHARKVQPVALLDLRTACFDIRAAEFDRLVSTVERNPGLVTAARVATAAYELTPVGACDDAAALLRRAPLPVDATARAAIQRIELSQAALDTRLLVEDLDGMDELVEEHLRLAKQTGYPPVVAGALFLAASVEFERDRYEHAASLFREAAYEAERGGDALLRARAECYLAGDLAFHLNRKEEANRAIDRGHAVLGRVQDDDVAAICARLDAYVAEADGRLGDARARAELAVALHTRSAGPVHLKTARAREALAWMLHEQRERARSLEEFRAALRIRQELLGPSHPLVGYSVAWVGSALVGSGHPEQGLEQLERGIEIMAPAGSRTDLAGARMRYGIALMRNKRYEEALAVYRQVEPVFADVWGTEGPRFADVLENIASVLARLGRHEEAIATAQRVVDIRRRASGPDHPVTADSTRSLGKRLFEAGRIEQAEASFRQAAESHIRRDGRESVLLMPTLLDWGEMLIAKERWNAAREPLLHARRVADAHPAQVPPRDRAWTLYYLACVDAELGSSTGARALATEALKIAEEAGDGELASEAAAFLARKNKP